MHEQPNQPMTLVSVPNEFEAAMIVSALASHEIDASTSGSFTAGFRAEAPGDVEVLVRHRDLQRAQTVLDEIQSQPPRAESAHSVSQAVAPAVPIQPWHLIGLLALLAAAVLYLWQ